MISSFRGEWAAFSNYYLCTVWFEKHIYNSVEHAYQAAKTLDEETRKLVRYQPTPNQAKQLARRLPLREDWDDVKLGIMESLLREKFAQQHLKATLLSSGNEELVEGNWWGDRYWGQCPLGQGHNHLGKLLMKLREEMKWFSMR